MDADEKLAALKKAYADVLFNMSKEAAMRVMSSDKRAAQYQYELKVAKEEALRMLMRLKQMMGFKTSQAEAASFNQQKKIEVLEAQLEEAEDIVNDLRNELGLAQAELVRLRQDNLQNSNKPTNAFSGGTEDGIYSYDFGKSFPPNSQDKNSDVTMSNQDLPSVTVRVKDPGLRKNGFTQRIHACEKNLSDDTLCLSGKTDKVHDKKNREQSQREKEEGEDTSKAPASGDKTLSELEKKLLPDRTFRNLQYISRKRKRAARKRKNVTPLRVGYDSDIVKDSDCLSENLFETASVLSQIKTETGFCLGSEKTLGKETNSVEISGEITPLKLVYFDDENASSSPDSKTDVEKVGVLSNGLELNSGYMSPGLTQFVGERVIKYTFQRKRKREALVGSNVNDAIETEKRAEAKQNGVQNLKKPKTSLSKESTRESRRLAQVARQLISLSEKKWWN
ncbi:sensor protein PhoQ [Striga asiatica]|uniref:Sensor protein PhoQ n=1 Tax=Striga asiatica TaxID=4170 RepID=A0A5A7QZY4_STRAF|nr:sensor protein PhoQ [Striga asiatica]